MTVPIICRRCATRTGMGRHQRQLGEVRANGDVTVFHRWGARKDGSRVRAITVQRPDDEFEEFSCRGCGARFTYRRSEILSMAGRARKAGEIALKLKPNLGRTLSFGERRLTQEPS